MKQQQLLLLFLLYIYIYIFVLFIGPVVEYVTCLQVFIALLFLPVFALRGLFPHLNLALLGFELVIIQKIVLLELGELTYFTQERMKFITLSFVCFVCYIFIF